MSVVPAETVSESTNQALSRLREARDKHEFWNNRLFRACLGGVLTLDDFRFMFSQYYLYSKNFTKYLAALMANCDNDFFRARLSENMWEEGGGIAPEKRHAEIFRNFLRRGLAIDISRIDYVDSARHFHREYLDFCMKSDTVAATAFFSLGTEGIVPRMYSIFTAGLLKAGINKEHLEFFRIHIECDDAHAATLEDMMMFYSSRSDWYEVCLRSMNRALELRMCFFENLFDALQRRRIEGILQGIQAKKSAVPELPAADSLLFNPAQDTATALYSNDNEQLNIQFSVERAPFNAEVLDPRIVRIAAGKHNENHRHAHETIFYIIAGVGSVLVNDAVIQVKAGDVVFVPRWTRHQSLNTGKTEMIILAVTDFGLTHRAYIGNYLKTARLNNQPNLVADV